MKMQTYTERKEREEIEEREEREKWDTECEENLYQWLIENNILQKI